MLRYPLATTRERRCFTSLLARRYRPCGRQCFVADRRRRASVRRAASRRVERHFVRNSATSSANPAGEIAYDRSAPEGVRPDEEAPLIGLLRAATVLVLLLSHFLAGAWAATGDVPSGRLLVKFRAPHAGQGRVERLAPRPAPPGG